MATFEGVFSSIVFIGRHNPQILNHDFLVKHNVLPKDQPPFKELFAKEGAQPFSEFISTPVLATIKYGPISIVVEESHFQTVDRRFEDPPSSPIMQIAKRYFGELLRYTPLQLGGINLNGVIRFSDVKDEHAFDERLGVDRAPLSGMVRTTDVRMGLFFSYPWKNGIVEVQLPKPKDRSKLGTINFNYEFKYKDIDGFLANLDDFGKVYATFKSLLKSLGIEGAP